MISAGGWGMYKFSNVLFLVFLHGGKDIIIKFKDQQRGY